ncbi:MAG TPA: hypothetical protein VLW83_05160, partial [Candidatus Acidoferrales bacterium]|nr:hypothetical protein [Candidatus Acidoferrales bacterium]
LGKQAVHQFSGRYTATSTNRRNSLKIKHGVNFWSIQNGTPAEAPRASLSGLESVAKPAKIAFPQTV